MREILHVHRRRLLSGRLQPGVQAKIADDEIGSAVAGEVASNDAVPPAVALLQAARLLFYQSTVSRVVKDRNGHPFAHDNEIRFPIAVDVFPHGIRNHSDVGKSGRRFVSDVREVSATIVFQKNAPRIETVTAGNAAAPHEQVNCTIAVKVSGDGTRAAQSKRR